MKLVIFILFKTTSFHQIKFHLLQSKLFKSYRKPSNVLIFHLTLISYSVNLKVFIVSLIRKALFSIEKIKQKNL